MNNKMIVGVIFGMIFMGPGILPAAPSGGEVAEALPQVRTYDELVSAIRITRNASKVRLQAAVEQEKVREAWETGKLIDEHVLHYQERAEYGEQVIVRLAKDLGTSDTELKYMLQFARSYPIRPPADELSWAHYRELLSVNDPKERDEVTRKASENHWNRDQIRQEVKARKRSGASSASTPGSGIPETTDVLEPIEPGPLDTYQIVRLKDSLKIDLGFGIYRDLSSVVSSPNALIGDLRQKAPNNNLKAGDIVESVKATDGTYRLDLKNAIRHPASGTLLYTYRAQVVSTVDGDTFHALIDLGFGITQAQRVRLRRVDAPEILTTEGQEAKALLEKILARDKGRVILQSRELDQYGRPLADVWVLGKPVDQELFDQGLAVAYTTAPERSR